MFSGYRNSKTACSQGFAKVRFLKNIDTSPNQFTQKIAKTVPSIRVDKKGQFFDKVSSWFGKNCGFLKIKVYFWLCIDSPGTHCRLSQI